MAVYKIGTLKISDAKLRVLEDIQRHGMSSKRNRGGFDYIFRRTSHSSKYIGRWYFHAHQLYEMGLIRYSEKKKGWMLTEKGKKILKIAKKRGLI